jgi:hypothetical protein
VFATGSEPFASLLWTKTMHANFAAVLGIKQQVIQDLVRILYLTDDIPHVFSINSEMQGFLKLNSELFSDIPEFIFSSEYTDSFKINLTSWGPLTVALLALQDGELTLVPETHEVKFDVEILVPHRITIEDEQLHFGMSTGNLTLSSKTITVLDGGSFSRGVQTLLDSSIFNNLLEQEIKNNMADINDSMPSINIDFLQPMLGPIMEEGEDSSFNLYTYARAFDGAMAIGIDIDKSGYATAGSPSQLTDITNDMDMAVVTNAQVFVPHLREELVEGSEEEPGIREEVRDQGATLQVFDVTMNEGYIHISARATKEGTGSVNFSFDVFPRLVVPAKTIDYGPDEFGNPYVIYIPSREELWFEIRNESVEVVTDFWIDLLRVVGVLFTFGALTVYIDQMIWSVRANAYAALAEADRVQGDNRTYEFQISEDAPVVRAHIEVCEFHGYGSYLGLSVTPLYPQGRIVCISAPSGIDLNETLRNRPFAFRVQLPYTVHPEDPNLHIRWRVRNMDNNTIMYNFDELYQDMSELEFTEFYNAIELLVSCRIYRTLGQDITDFLNVNVKAALIDRLDRTHPYIRWHHYAYTPDITVESDGSRTQLGGHIKYRTSRIHRTDFPGRCWMAAQYSLHTPSGFRPPPKKKSRIEYLDSLPFPVADLQVHRHELCDYCFFGGPNNTQPLPLPSLRKI